MTNDPKPANSSRECGPLDVLIGQRLKRRRLTLDMSQYELGAQVGVSFQQIQKYEKGVNRVSAVTLHEICKVLSVPVDYFFREPDQLKQTHPQLDQALETLGNRDALAIARAFDLVKDPKMRRSIVELVETLATQLLASPNTNDQ